ncbi:MAG TPA: alcohol dehydrogenase catalytic domain-containing protein [Solirubrobacterales bacterium]|nr:alcohol dehydrogenase catalytic domain-containing protein [Solirubrobacterales bacterium]
MRELNVVEEGRLEWREKPDPRLEARTDAIVRPLAASTCDVDRFLIEGTLPLELPFALGHECIGEVLDAGDAVTHVGPGDLVIVPWHIACGRCDRCRAGLTAHCRSVPPASMFGAPLGGDWSGLFSDLVRVPYADTMLVPMPVGLDPVALASAGDNWALAWRLVGPHLEKSPGARVLILSIGSIGLYACDIAGALGASRRLYVDRDPGRREIAASYGAEVAAEIEPIFQGFEIAVDATSDPEMLATACRSLVPEGICESAGHLQPAELPLLEMWLSSVNLRIARDNARAHIHSALDLVQSGRVDPRRVVTDVLDWETLPEALPELRTKPVFVREPLTASSA